MNIGVLSNKTNYKSLFEQDNHIQSVIILDGFNETTKPAGTLHALLVDGETVSYQELAVIRDTYPNIPIFFKLHNVKSHVLTKNIERICTAHTVTPIHENYTMEQVAKEVLKSLIQEEDSGSKRVVAFFGTHSGAGVSTTVLNVAKAISDRVQERVLVLSLNAWDPADYFLQYEGKYLNDLKVELKTRTLTPAKLGESVFQYGDFYHLAGNRDIKLQRYFTNEEISHLIEVAKETFDLILIDGGTHFDTANATQAYVSSDLRFLVTNQEDKGYRGYFPHVFQQMIEPSGGKRSDFMLILNQFKPNMSLISEKDLEEELEMNRIVTLPDMDILGAVAIRQKNLLYEVAEGQYKKNVDIVSNLIVSESHLNDKPLEEGQETKKGLFGGLFQKKLKEEVKVR